eukprot:3271848-Pleurochrysis_carterae.AAC.1
MRPICRGVSSPCPTPFSTASLPPAPCPKPRFFAQASLPRFVCSTSAVSQSRAYRPPAGTKDLAHARLAPLGDWRRLNEAPHATTTARPLCRRQVRGLPASEQV